jgi:hypothetical protein
VAKNILNLRRTRKIDAKAIPIPIDPSFNNKDAQII